MLARFGPAHPEQQKWVGATASAEAKAEYDKWDVKQPTTTEERLAIARDASTQALSLLLVVSSPF